MSMIKYCGLPTCDDHGNRTVVQIQAQNMTKTAGYDNFGEEMRGFIASLKPEEGYAYLLIAAMGDQNWGPNRNSDYWPTLALSNPTQEYGYKTYETNGNWYHHHQNKRARPWIAIFIRSTNSSAAAKRSSAAEYQLAS